MLAFFGLSLNRNIEWAEPQNAIGFKINRSFRKALPVQVSSPGPISLVTQDRGSRALNMAAQNSKKDVNLLKNLVPLNTLTEAQLVSLQNQIVVEQVKKGDFLFRQGDKDHHNVYLLSGAVALLSGRKEVDVVSSGTQTARFALAHQFPRKESARAKCPVSFVRIDSRLLSDLLASNQSASYEVNETGDPYKGDWMGQLLQLPIFQQIPPANLQRVMMSMDELTASADELIIQQGDEGDYFYMISAGQCRVTRQASPDESPVELAVLSAGQGFGEEALLSDKPRTSTVTMLTDGVLVRLSKQDFVELVKQPVSNQVDFARAVQMSQENAQWVDVRSPEDYALLHFPGAINLPFSSLRLQTPSLEDNCTYLIYGGEAGQTATAAYLLLERGYDVLVVVEGWREIAVQAGLLTADGLPPQDATLDTSMELSVSHEVGSPQAASERLSSEAVRAYETKLAQYQTEQKLLKQALAVAKRKLERAEQEADKHQQAQKQELERLTEQLSAAQAEQAEDKRHAATEHELSAQLEASAEQLGRLESELSQAREDSRQAVEARQRLEQTLEAAGLERQQALTQSQEQITALTQQLEHTTNALESLKRQSDGQQQVDAERLTDLQAQLAAARQEIDQIKSQSADDRAELERQRDALQSQLQSVQVEHEQAGQQATDNLTSLEQALADLKQQHAELQGRYEAQQAEHQESETRHRQTIEQLTADLTEAGQRSSEAESRLESYRQSSDASQEDFQRRLAEIQDRLTDAGRQLEQQAQEILALQEQLKLAQDEKAALNTEYEALQQTHEADLGQIEALREQRAAADAAGQEQRQGLERDLEAARDELQANQEALQETQSESQRIEQQFAELQARFDQEHQTAEFLRRSLETAENAVEISDTMVEENKREATELQQRLLDLQAELSGIVSARDEREQAQQTEIGELQDKLAQLQEEQARSLAEYQTEVQRREHEMESLVTEKSRLESELERIQADLEASRQRLKTTAAEHQRRIDQLEQDLQAAQAAGEVREQQEALQQAEQEIQRLTSTIEGLREVQLEMESQSSEDSADELQRLHAALENEQKKRREIETVARQVDVLRRERAVQETAVEMLGEDIENLTSENARLAEVNQELERRLVQLQGGQAETSSGAGQQVDGNDRHGEVEELEQQRDAARADVARLQGEVNELRGVIETHVNRLQCDGALDADDEVRALRSELEMVRKKAEEDLEQLRGQLAAADNPGKRQSDRDVNTVATLQALRQEIDSTQRALSDKEQTLRKSQSQCRSLEDAIEDRDKEIDQLRRKLESLLRKTSGMVESSEFLVSSLHDIPERLKDESEQITLARSEQQTRGMPEMESEHQRTSLGRLFRKR